MDKIFVKAGGRQIAMTGNQAKNLAESRHFKKWLERLYHDSGVVSIDVVWVGYSIKKEARFALLQVAYKDRKGLDRTNTIFYRPDAVGVLVVVRNKETNARYAVCVKQLRVPAGGMLVETPAGMIEFDDDPVLTALREIEEETGFTIKQENLISLGGYYLSPGACPEKMFFFACEIFLTSAEIEKLQGKNTGLHEEGEDLRLHLVPFFDLPSEVEDAKSLLAYYMYIDWKGKHLEKR